MDAIFFQALRVGLSTRARWYFKFYYQDTTGALQFSKQNLEDGAGVCSLWRRFGFWDDLTVKASSAV